MIGGKREKIPKNMPTHHILHRCLMQPNKMEVIDSIYNKIFRKSVVKSHFSDMTHFYSGRFIHTHIRVWRFENLDGRTAILNLDVVLPAPLPIRRCIYLFRLQREWVNYRQMEGRRTPRMVKMDSTEKIR